MAVFHHNSRSISYRVSQAPFAQDLILLQSSKFNADFWRAILAEFEAMPPGDGRVLTCEWFETGRSEDLLADDIAHMVITLGFDDGSVVACGDAGALVDGVEKLRPGIWDRTLMIPEISPKSDDLSRRVRSFCWP